MPLALNMGVVESSSALTSSLNLRAQSDSQHPAQHPWTDNRMFSSLHDLQALDIDGKPLGFKAATEGKVTLLPMVARETRGSVNTMP